jgi:4-alpha-glucanotransferase
VTPARYPRASGILLHPTSLPGPHGCGDFGLGAYRFVDWLAGAGQSLWQILPLTMIGPGNSPYMSVSAFAGNPLLIDLDDLGARDLLDRAELARASFSPDRVDYGVSTEFRMRMLRDAAKKFFAATSDEHLEFYEFCVKQRDWLDDFTLFMAHSQKHPGLQWHGWQAGIARRNPGALETCAAEHLEEVQFWKFVQWNFYRQWLKLRTHANERGVKIIGDLPIFIAHDSVDVWARPDLFFLDDRLSPTVVAGVPPDYFSDTGQLWGNPLYRWDAHESDGFSWWIRRLKAMNELVDIIRIDHFRGLAGYWEIPAGQATAVNGRWVPGPGAKFFQAAEAALGDLPILAEDLGLITPDVIELRDQFRLPGMRILQFAFADDTDNPYLPHNYERNTAVYTGTHDNDTTRAWFAAIGDRERAFVQKYLKSDGREIQWDFIHAASESVADLAIYPMQDVLGLGSEARMNQPGEAAGSWQWRFQWQQVEPWHATRLREISAIHGRNGIVPLPLPE